MILFIRLILSFLSAYLFGRILYCHLCNRNNNDLISKFHSFYLGLGVTSITFWFYTVITNGNNIYYPIVELAFIFIAYPLFRKQSLNLLIKSISLKKRKINTKTPDYLKNSISVFLLILILLLSLIHCLHFPNGAWDAISMWNMKTKFLCSGSSHWTSFFSSTFDHSHPDYPLMLPCILARTCTHIGELKIVISIFFSWLFCISNFILLYLYLKKLKGINYSLFSICILGLSQNLFLEGSKQYADILLSLFFLISLYELIDWHKNHSAKIPWLCLIFSSFSLWIKNEGIPWFLFYALTIIFYTLIPYKKNNIRILSVFLASAPAIISCISVKYLASSNDLTTNILYRFNQIIDFNRYKPILFFSWELLKNHLWIFIIPVCIIFNYCDNRYTKYTKLLLLPLSMYFCYFSIYLLSPHDLIWHLETSFPRIMTSLLPMLMFLGCLIFSKEKKN